MAGENELRSGLIGQLNQVPEWSPLLDPVTVTALRSEGAREEKMISDCGEASGVPGKGITCRAGWFEPVVGEGAAPTAAGAALVGAPASASPVTVVSMSAASATRPRGQVLGILRQPSPLRLLARDYIRGKLAHACSTRC